MSLWDMHNIKNRLTFKVSKEITKIEEKCSIFIMKYANYDTLHVILPDM